MSQMGGRYQPGASAVNSYLFDNGVEFPFRSFKPSLEGIHLRPLPETRSKGVESAAAAFQGLINRLRDGVAAVQVEGQGLKPRR